MLKEMPELRAPEKRRTGMEMSPKVLVRTATARGLLSETGSRSAIRFGGYCEVTNGDAWNRRVVVYAGRDSHSQA
jgi:hypothetical protein